MSRSHVAVAEPVARRPDTVARLRLTADRVWERAPLREPWRVLAPLLLVEWLALALFILSVHHNGLLFYQGGDQIWYWSSSWLMGHGSITVPRVSYGWPLVTLPFAWVAGPSFVSGLPAVVLLQVLVLTPIALYCMYDIGARIGGRIVGYLAALGWTAGPYLVIPLFVQRYHEKYVEEFLPHPLGLTAMADYPALVLLIAATALGLRAAQARDPATALVAGLVAGFSAGMKPSNAIWLPAFALLLLLGTRWRELMAFGLGVLPAFAALSLWKYRGYGYLPAFHQSYQEVRLAAGANTLLYPYHHYVHINWHQLHINQLQLGEFFFSMRVLELAPVVGAIAVARRSWRVAVFLSVWFWGFVLLKGSSESASVEGGSFFRFVLPAAPALLLMLAALPVLVPRIGTRLAERFPAPVPRPLGLKTIVVSAVVLGLVPLAATAAVRPQRSFNQTVIQVNGLPAPQIAHPSLEAAVAGPKVRLAWRSSGSWSGDVFYRLFRAPGKSDLDCFLRTQAAAECHEIGTVVASTRGRSAVDRPRNGTWTYRLGVAANWRNDPRQGDVFLVSEPVTVKVR